MDEIIEKINNGSIKQYEIERFTKDANEAATIRRKALETKTGKSLEKTGSSSIDFNDALNRNIENPIGAAQIPIGYAGDLKVNGGFANASYPILLASTEGKLVAGVARGLSVLNRAGGANVSVTKDGMTRDVLVRTGSAREAARIARFIASGEGFAMLERAFAASTSHGKLAEARPYVSGRDLHIRYRATTGAAMGMNMVTIAAKDATELLVSHMQGEGVDAELLSESGNMCSDKKPAFINFLEGRGVSAVADVRIPRAVVMERFKVEPEAIAELNKAKNLVGSALAGSHGFNAHVANILAAMYIAHGQDVAQIVEGSQAITDAGVIEGDLYVSLYMPAIEVGTFGGGSKRETQMEALRLLGLYGEGDSDGKTRLAFAEVVAAACLAGELNLIAAQAGRELAKSHGQLKREKQ